MMFEYIKQYYNVPAEIGREIMFEGNRKGVIVEDNQWKGYHFGMIENEVECIDINELIKSPIPLTEEILLKAGFEKKDNDYQTDFIEWCEKEFPVIGILCQSSDKTYLFDEETDTLRIYYLHQLQNLVKALTGNELEVNL